MTTFHGIVPAGETGHGHVNRPYSTLCQMISALGWLVPRLFLPFILLYEFWENRRLRMHLQQAEQKLTYASEELEELDHLKTDFVSMVSHELRTPLTNINGAIELLLQPDADLEPAQVQAMLHIVWEQSQRLTRLVEGTLTVSRIDAGGLTLHPTWVDVPALIARAVHELRGQTTVHEFCIRADETLPQVWADSSRLNEVLLILLDNAVKYSPQGGPIVIAAVAQNDELRVSISDSGVGIRAEDLDAIFGQFYRLERGNTRETYGYGLGLYVARKLVEAHHGRMWAESRPGEGSTFYFSLPLNSIPDETDLLLEPSQYW